VSPEAFKQALEQRLRTAPKTGADFARKRQLLVFDRFLAAPREPLAHGLQLCDFGHRELHGLIGGISVSSDRKLVQHELVGGRFGLFARAGANPAGCVAEAVNPSRFDVDEEEGTSLDQSVPEKPPSGTW
jgi:hypothetical protein